MALERWAIERRDWRWQLHCPPVGPEGEHAQERRCHWLHDWRWGWAPETWTVFLESLNPSLVDLCGSVHLQPGLLMSVLSYNDARFGLKRCELIAFYPRACASQDVGARPGAKHLEQGHMADHVLERVSSAYADFRLAAHRVARKRNLKRAVSAEEGIAVKRQLANGEAREALTAAAPAAQVAHAPAPNLSVSAHADGRNSSRPIGSP